MIYVLKIIWDYWGATIGTYRPQYRMLSAISYLDANPLPTRNTLFSTLAITLHTIWHGFQFVRWKKGKQVRNKED
jgi:hypothetical protein